MHLLWHLESEACKFEGRLPKNVWFLRNPESSTKPAAPHETIPNELTFQVVPEPILNELAKAQVSGIIPEKYRKMHVSETAAE